MGFDNENFRELMLKAIGNTPRAEFARKCGITPQHLSRLMSEKNDVTPSRNTLQKIADNSTASIEELMIACGHISSAEKARLSMTIKERAEKNAVDMINGFGDLTKNVRLYQSIQDFLEDYKLIYSNEDVKFSCGPKKEYLDDEYSNAEYYIPAKATFITRKHECSTWLVIYFCETKGGRYVITNVSLSGKDLFDAQLISTRVADILYEDGEDVNTLPYMFTIRNLPEIKSEEEKLLAAIFGDPDAKRYPFSMIGFGFEIESCPEKFAEFLKEHKATFCKDNYSESLCARIVDEGENPEKVLADYNDEYTDHPGFGAAISNIMRAETDIAFGLYVDEDDSTAAVMVLDEDRGYINRAELKDIVCKYAKELGIEEYGECIIVISITKDPNGVFKTTEK